MEAYQDKISSINRFYFCGPYIYIVWLLDFITLKKQAYGLILAKQV